MGRLSRLGYEIVCIKRGGAQIDVFPHADPIPCSTDYAFITSPGVLHSFRIPQCFEPLSYAEPRLLNEIRWKCHLQFFFYLRQAPRTVRDASSSKREPTFLNTSWCNGIRLRPPAQHLPETVKVMRRTVPLAHLEFTTVQQCSGKIILRPSGRFHQ